MPRETPATATTPSTGSRRRLWLGLFAVLAVPFVFYGSMILQNLEPRAPDTLAVKPFSVWADAASEELGETPQWYPYIFSGMPSYGSFIYTPASPYNVLAWMKQPFADRRGARYYLLFAIGGVAAFFFFRRQEFSVAASSTAALAYVMTPYFTGNVGAGHSTKLEALCLIPLFFLALDFALRRPGFLAAGFLAGAGALLAWSNHPQIVYYGGLLGALYAAAVLLWEQRGQARWVPVLGTVAVAAVIAAGLITLPYLVVQEYVPFSIRGSGSALAAAGEAANGGGLDWDYATAWSFHPKELITFLFPSWYGLQGNTYWGAMPFTQSSHYVGVVVLLLAGAGVLRGRGRRRWIWFALSVLVLVIGFGRHLPVLYRPLYEALPLFDRFRVPSMIYGLLPFTLGYLLAEGIDWLRGAVAPEPSRAGRKKGEPRKSEARTDRRRALWIAGAATVGGAVLFLVAAKAGLSGADAMIRPQDAQQLPPEAIPMVQADRWDLLAGSIFRSALLVLAAIGVIAVGVLGLVSRERVRPWIGWGLALVVVVDLFLLDRAFHHPEPVVSAEATVPVEGALRFLEEQPGEFRVFPVGSLFTSNSLGLFGVESVGGYQPAKMRVYQDLLDADLISAPGVLRMLDVEYLVSAQPLEIDTSPVYQGGGFVYRMSDPLPRAWSVPRVERVADARTLFARLDRPDFDPGAVAYVHEDAEISAERFETSEVSLVSRGLHEIRLQTEGVGPSFLVLSEIHYPPAWQVEIDGNAAAVHQVNHVLRGVEVPAGSHEVVFRHHSPAMELAELAGGIAAAVLVALLAVGTVRARRTKGASGGA